MTTCSDIMKPDVPCILANSTLVSVASVMKQHSLKLLPVVEDLESKKLLGFVTQEDLVFNVIAENRNPKVMSAADLVEESEIFCHEHDPIEKALRLLSTFHLDRIDVVNEDGNLVGQLHLDDALKATAQPAAAQISVTVAEACPA